MQTLIEQFHKELLEVTNFKINTVSAYISILDKYFDYVNEQFKIDPLEAQSIHLRQWMDLKMKEFSNSYLTHHKAALKHFYAFLQKLAIRDDNPAEALFPILRPKSDLNQPITSRTAFKLLRSIDRTTWVGERNFMIISLLWALGLRLNELITLKVKDFEPDHDPAGKIGLLRVHGKGDRQRALWVVNKLYENLIHYLEHPKSPKCKTAPLFITEQKNTVISRDRVQRMIKESTLKAGITQRITPHVLRHSFATEMYHREVPAKAIQALLGHGHLAETAIYIHVSPSLQKHALNEIIIAGRSLCQ
jgi:integrase/recombinase XerD